MLQALAVLTTVGEAAARWAVAGAQNRAVNAEGRAEAEQLRQRTDQTRHMVLAEQDRAARGLVDRAFDSQWMSSAGLPDAAELWRTAARYAASGDLRAQEAIRRVEDRLHQLSPFLMDAYHRRRSGGLPMADAMRAAAH